MFGKKSTDSSALDEAIQNVLNEMQGYTSETDEYAQMVRQLQKLYKLQAIDKPPRVSPDTLAVVAANLIGIIVIVGHERAHVITSKATNFLFKLR